MMACAGSAGKGWLDASRRFGRAWSCLVGNPGKEGAGDDFDDLRYQMFNLPSTTFELSLYSGGYRPDPRQ